MTHVAAHTFGEHAGAGQIRLRQQGNKLITAIASEKIGGSQRLPAAVCHGLDHAIARGVSLRIVDVLEVIDVDHQHGQRMAKTLGSSHFDLGQGQEMRTVERVRHAVFIGPNPKGALRPATNRAVACRACDGRGVEVLLRQDLRGPRDQSFVADAFVLNAGHQDDRG